MSTSTAERQQGGIAAGLVEYQMRFREVIGKAAAAGPEASAIPQQLRPFVTVSREAGSGGSEVARIVGARLGWAVLDRQLVDGLANELKLQPKLLELVDETRANWFSETLLNLFNSRLVEQHSYVALVGKTVALAASSESVVVVGRGAHLILPTDHGLRVRIVAPRLLRARTVALAESIEETAALDRIDEVDAHRRSFIRRNFRRDADDATFFDLVINTAHLGIDGAVEQILTAARSRGLAA